MKKCIHHPGRESVITINNNNYCQECKDSQEKAVKKVDQHVEPKDCFIWYQKKDTWAPIPGTGCAHWVAHKKSIKNGLKINKCLEGFSIKVSDIYIGKTEVKKIEDVKVGDIYVNPMKTHCGIVSKVQKVPPSNQIKIEIEHASSRQKKVAKNDFKTYFKGSGKFYR